MIYKITDIPLTNVTEVIMQKGYRANDIIYLFITTDPRKFIQAQFNHNGITKWCMFYDLEFKTRRVISRYDDTLYDHFEILHTSKDILNMSHFRLEKLGVSALAEGEYLTSSEFSYDTMIEFYQKNNIKTHAASSLVGKKEMNKLRKYDDLFNGNL